MDTDYNIALLVCGASLVSDRRTVPSLPSLSSLSSPLHTSWIPRVLDYRQWDTGEDPDLYIRAFRPTSS